MIALKHKPSEYQVDDDHNGDQTLVLTAMDGSAMTLQIPTTSRHEGIALVATLNGETAGVLSFVGQPNPGWKYDSILVYVSSIDNYGKLMRWDINRLENRTIKRRTAP